MEFVEATVKNIDERLAVLDEERARLANAREVLTDTTTTSNEQRTRRTRSSSQNGAKRNGSGRRGKRGTQALELIRDHPGITIPGLAKEMGILPNYLYRVLPPLEEQGKIKREGKAWHPA